MLNICIELISRGAVLIEKEQMELELQCLVFLFKLDIEWGILR